VYFIRTFLKKHRAILIALCAIGAFWAYFSARYKIGIAYNSTLPCINAKLVIIDKWDTDVPVGSLATFRMNKENEFFPKGIMWTKVVAAKQGMEVDVQFDKVIVDGKKEYNIGFEHLLKHTSQTESDVIRKLTVTENNYFMVGETITSYDSRYWGEVDQKDIIGKAYVVF